MRVNLTVKYFDNSDLETLNDWLLARDKKLLQQDDLPAVGVMVLEDEFPLACCFLRRCEGNYGIVEGLATNPEAPGPLRHVAIDTAVRYVMEEAKVREITQLIAWTVDNGTLERAIKRHGFVQSQQTFMTCDLSETLKTH